MEAVTDGCALGKEPMLGDRTGRLPVWFTPVCSISYLPVSACLQALDHLRYRHSLLTAFSLCLKTSVELVPMDASVFSFQLSLKMKSRSVCDAWAISTPRLQTEAMSSQIIEVQTFKH